MDDIDDTIRRVMGTHSQAPRGKGKTPPRERRNTTPSSQIPEVIAKPTSSSSDSIFPNPPLGSSVGPTLGVFSDDSNSTSQEPFVVSRTPRRGAASRSVKPYRVMYPARPDNVGIPLYPPEVPSQNEVHLFQRPMVNLDRETFTPDEWRDVWAEVGSGDVGQRVPISPDDVTLVEGPTRLKLAQGRRQLLRYRVRT